ncbi:GNAT family N-acetyltransferase [Streptomyces sp. 1331.2]|uniref:GNAT family N-acetyltransferase n=1 Tax=Streptomyces sp. 1331.2 TaxID=1938835 RepID=UPI000BD295A0|nr:GNAT family protein [Streptomyces sp. 1331.2]SOB82817.1 Protein N-acetyltransferase, RimJ/RimL family [Streptomyces sp. 1331.2]
MDFPSTFDARGLRLRPYRDSDVPVLVANGNDPDTVRFMSGTPGAATAETMRALLASAASRARQNPDRLGYAVADPDGDELLAGAVVHLTRRRSSAELGFWVAPAARGRGVATTLARALTELCFARGLHRVELFIRDENVRSQRVALAAGFRREGELRAVLPGAGTERHAAALWSRLPTDDAPTPRRLPDLPNGELTDTMVTLRPVGPDDVAALAALHGHTPVGAPGAPQDRDDLARHCARAPARWLAGERADVLVVGAAGQVAAELTLEYRAPGAGRAELRAVLAPGGPAAALATRGVELLARWAFGIGVELLVATEAPQDARLRGVLTQARFDRQELFAARDDGRRLTGGLRADRAWSASAVHAG